MPAADAAALLRRNATDPGLRDRPAVKFDDRVWTHAEFVGEAHRWANLFHARKPKGRALHVGVLLDNTPDYLFALGEIHRVLMHDGELLLSLPYTTLTEHHMVNPFHCHNFNERSFDFFDPALLKGSAAEDSEIAFRKVLVRFSYIGYFGALPKPARAVPQSLPEVLLVSGPTFFDGRGHFSETFRKADFAAAGIDCDFVQENMSKSAGRGTVRVTASPYHIDGLPVHSRGPAAYRVGEHTRVVLGDLLGYPAARIAELARSGVIDAP